MATEFLIPKNFASGMLADDIASDDLSITLETGEADNFPALFPFHVVIDNEVMTVTEKVSGADEFVVTRGAEDSTAVVHYTGAEVKLAITAEYLSQLQDAVNVLEGYVVNPAAMPNLVLGDGSAETKIEMFNESVQKALIKAAATILALYAPNNTSLGLQILDGGHIRAQGGKVYGALAGLLELFADTDVKIYLDADNDGANNSLIVYNGAGNEVFRIYEQGRANLRRNDSGTAGESSLCIYGTGSNYFLFNTLSSNLQLQNQSGEIVRFNYDGTRFLKDLKPLYNWNGTTPNFGANLGSATEIWKDAHIKNVVNYGAIISPPQTLAISTTPSILNGRVFKVPVLSSGEIAIASFADLVNGQEIILLGVAQSPSFPWTIAASNTFSTINGTWTSAAGATLHLIYDSGTSKWFEISRR